MNQNKEELSAQYHLLLSAENVLWKLNHNWSDDANTSYPAKIDRNDATVRGLVGAIDAFRAMAEKFHYPPSHAMEIPTSQGNSSQTVGESGAKIVPFKSSLVAIAERQDPQSPAKKTFLVKIEEEFSEEKGFISEVLADGPDAETVGKSVLSTWYDSDYNLNPDDDGTYVVRDGAGVVRLESVQEVPAEHVSILKEYFRHLGVKDQIHVAQEEAVTP